MLNQTMRLMTANFAANIRNVMVILQCQISYERHHGRHSTVLTLKLMLSDYRLLPDSTEIIDRLSVPIISPAGRLANNFN
jgi:hypothetical protein